MSYNIAELTSIITMLGVLWGAYSAWRYVSREYVAKANIEFADTMLAKIDIYQQAIGILPSIVDDFVDIRSGRLSIAEPQLTDIRQRVIKSTEEAKCVLDPIAIDAYAVLMRFGMVPFLATLTAYQIAIEAFDAFNECIRKDEASTDGVMYQLAMSRFVFFGLLGQFFAEVARGSPVFISVARLKIRWRLSAYSGEIPMIGHVPNFRHSASQIRIGSLPKPHRLEVILENPPKQYQNMIATVEASKNTTQSTKNPTR